MQVVGAAAVFEGDGAPVGVVDELGDPVAADLPDRRAPLVLRQGGVVLRRPLATEELEDAGYVRLRRG